MSPRHRAVARPIARVGAVSAMLLLGLALAVALRDDPRPKLDRSRLVSMLVEDRSGMRLAELAGAEGGFHRPVALDAISPHLVAATLSSEDAGFFRHAGVDPVGVLRAARLNAQAGRFAYGGSTITQQLAKLIDPEPRTFGGKAREALDALRLEWALDKRAILGEYLNRAYYGRGATGVEAAAWRFFGTSASGLSLAQAALLACLPRAPSAYDPERHPERAVERRRHVLGVMARRGWVTGVEARAAAREPIVLAALDRRVRARHVVDHVLAHVERAPTVRTTIDLGLQERVEVAVREHLAALAERAVDQAGAVVLDNATGEVLAMVGSRRYGEVAASGAVNATTSLRAPGSTLKPFVYALALEAGAAPSTAVLDVPTERAGYRPRSGLGDHRGLVSLRAALGSSLNAPAVRVAEQVGPGSVAALLRRLGLTLPEREHGLSIALGGVSTRLVDLASAYATLARGGDYLPWRITMGSPLAPKRVLSAQTAFLVTDMLSDAEARRLAFGVETPLDLPFPVAAKTGTSQSFCDNLTVGYTPEITVAVWVGNFDGRPMHSVLAMSGAAPLFARVMRLGMEGREARERPRPSGMHDAEICPLSGLRRGPHCPAGHVEVTDGRHPLEPCDWHSAEGARVPAELIAFRGDLDATPLPGAADVTVASPGDGERLRIDPLLPEDVQALLLRAELGAPGAESVEWFVDGRSVATSAPGAAAAWRLEPGRHAIVAVARFSLGGEARTARSHAAVITVEASES